MAPVVWLLNMCPDKIAKAQYRVLHAFFGLCHAVLVHIQAVLPTEKLGIKMQAPTAAACCSGLNFFFQVSSYSYGLQFVGKYPDTRSSQYEE